ncbi:MAG: hypothetical protein IIA45_00130 [Bacteroidetes bacterium]|nr:hypothetical protein [Bacteroidota bacterium]
MEEIHLLKEIEQTYPVENIEVRGMQFWPYLRIYIADKLFFNKDRRAKVDKKIAGSFFRSWYYGFSSLFKKYDYFIFSASHQRRKIGDKYVDRCDYIADELPSSLYFELPKFRHYPKRKIPTQNIVSKYVLYLVEAFYSKFLLGKVKITGEEIIREIFEKYEVQVDHHALARRLVAQNKAGNWFAARYKPKAVFLIAPYTNMPFVKAFKDRGIKVIELQHGVINRSHYAYNISKSFDRNFYPDYLLTFGAEELEVFNADNFYIQKSRVIPVGSFYIDYVSSEYQPDNKLRTIKKPFKNMVAVTGQEALEDLLIPFLVEAANSSSETLFVYIPRYHKDGYYDRFDFPENLKLIDWLDTYELIADADFHATISSTCALEAPSLGTQNILINLEGRAREYYGEALNDEKITKYADSVDEFVRLIREFNVSGAESIKESNKHIIMPGYRHNIKAALNHILN